MNASGKADFLKKFSDNIFIFAVFLIIMIAIISFYQFNKLIKTNNWVTHTYEVILNANNSIYFYNYLESKQREYMLFSDVDALESFNLHIKKIDDLLNKLTQLTADNPMQQARMKIYNADIKDRIILFNKAVELKKNNLYTTEKKNELYAKGKILSNEINSIAKEIIDHEKVLLQERNGVLFQEIKVINYVVTAGQILSIMFLLAAFIVSRKQHHQRIQIEKNTKNLSLQLKSIIEGANDMIAGLDNDYRYLIFNEVYRAEVKKLFGKEIEIGKSIEDVLADKPEAKAKILDAWQKSLSGDSTVKTIEFLVDGVLNTYELTPSLIKKENGVTLGALHIIRNITERIKEQNQLKISYEKLNAATNELKIKNDKISLLLEMSDILLVIDSMEELNTVIPKYCSRILSFSNGNFYIMRPSKDILELRGQWGEPAVNTGIFTQSQCWSLRLGRIHHSSLKTNDLICAHVHAIPDKELGYVCLPLRAQNEVFGVLYIEYDISTNKKLSDTEKLLINAFAEVMALALANVRLRDNLRYQSIRDPLTTLYNRRYLEEFLTSQLFLAQRENIPLTILIMDLDHFKRVNDVHGHDAGDFVLKEFSRLLLKFVRRSDLATRFGGEEFVVVLFADKEGGKRRAEEIREAVSHLNIKYGNQNIDITVSIGMSSFPESATEGKELIELADKALYFAKNNGRNRVAHYDEVLEKEGTMV